MTKTTVEMLDLLWEINGMKALLVVHILEILTSLDQVECHKKLIIVQQFKKSKRN